MKLVSSKKATLGKQNTKPNLEVSILTLIVNTPCFELIGLVCVYVMSFVIF